MSTAEYVDIRKVVDPNVIEYVKASEIKRGDQIVVVATIFTVTATVTLYNLAYADGEPVRTSGGRWNVLHILTNYGGLVRFPHEDVARLARV